MLCSVRRRWFACHHRGCSTGERNAACMESEAFLYLCAICPQYAQVSYEIVT